MDKTALKVGRMPALLALLLAVFAVIPAAAGAENWAGWPAATAPIEAPAATFDSQPAATSLAEPGEDDLSDGGDSATLCASGRTVAPPPGQISRHGAFACPARHSPSYRARAPPSL